MPTSASQYRSAWACTDLYKQYRIVRISAGISRSVPVWISDRDGLITDGWRLNNSPSPVRTNAYTSNHHTA